MTLSLKIWYEAGGTKLQKEKEKEKDPTKEFGIRDKQDEFEIFACKNLKQARLFEVRLCVYIYTKLKETKQGAETVADQQQKWIMEEK